MRRAIERHAKAEGTSAPEECSAATLPATAPPAIDTVARIFNLTSFERAILLLCAGMELDARFAGLCAAAQGDQARPYPTFSLALAALPEPHWSALAPAAPLRRWNLIETSAQQASLTTGRLRIDERVLYFLAGVQQLDERVASLLDPMERAGELAPSQVAVARRMIAIWSRVENPQPVIQLCGGDESSRREIATAGAMAAGITPYAVAAEDLPSGAGEFDAFLRLWEREAALTASMLYVDAESLDGADHKSERRVRRLLERAPGPMVVSVRERIRPLRRPMKTIEVRKPSTDEQRALWEKLLADQAAQANGAAGQLAAQFNLSSQAIRATVEEAMQSDAAGSALPRALWDAGRAQARPRLEDLAQRIEPAAQWDDLVLPEREKSLLREIEANVQRRTTVYDVWGFGQVGGGRGLGISALFSGASGTGKTMAAEVLAHALRLDLYRVDLSCVVSKYIGETEKNLRRVFDAAEDGGAILFFDEADALFGKRSEVKDSHDRYANIEINYLLQRMESYRGLAVLATNMKSAMDPAFLRRLRFAVHFPFPAPEQRAEIWRRVFPENTPVEGLDIHKLARLNVAGGNIRNIALSAAFLAADAGEPVRMTHLARAVHSEFAKIERPVPEAEIAGW